MGQMVNLLLAVTQLCAVVTIGKIRRRELLYRRYERWKDMFAIIVADIRFPLRVTLSCKVVPPGPLIEEYFSTAYLSLTYLISKSTST